MSALVHGLLILLWIVEMVRGRCPDGYIRHDDSCYVESDTTASWAEAMIYCQSFGGHLASVENSAEEVFISGWLGRFSKYAFKPGQFWLSGSNLLTNGTWTWLPTLHNITGGSWATGEPSSDKGKNCLAMDFVHQFLWYTASCENKYNFICELDLVNNAIIG